MGYSPGRLVFFISLLVSGFVPGWAAETFPWIEATPADLALQTVEAHADAPAVFLNRKTLLVLGFTGFKGNQTHVDEYRRLKILNAEGLSMATISLPSIDYARIKRLDARITQPDGSTRMLSKSDIFSKTQSKSERYKIISFALPQAEIGSIIEYRFTLVHENLIQPWQLFFQGWLPVLESTIAVDVNEYTEYNINVVSSLGQEPETETEARHSQFRNLRTSLYTYTLRDLPLVPEEPFSPPFEEVAARVEMMPLRYRSGPRWIRLAKNISWPGLAHSFTERLAKYREWAPKTEAFVKQRTAGLTSERAKATALYEFVRTSIELGASPCKEGLCPPDKVLKARVGTSWDRVLLLQHMLTIAGLDASPVWLSPRTDAKMSRSFPDYSRVNYVLVAVTLAGEHVFLDPSNRTDRLGILQPDLQGVSCVLVDGKSSGWSKTPMEPAASSARRVSLEMKIDETGQITGKGRMVLTGNHAWLRTMWARDELAVVSAWQRWMEPGAGVFSDWVAAQFPEFKVTVTGLVWNDEEDGLVGSWELAPGGLGETDYISLASTAPLGLDRNPFALPPDQRVTPARLLFPFVDELELHLTWLDGWSLDSFPEATGIDTYVGKLTVESKKGTGEFYYHRTFNLELVDINGSFAYEKLHELYAETLLADMAPIVLVKD